MKFFPCLIAALAISTPALAQEVTTTSAAPESAPAFSQGMSFSGIDSISFDAGLGAIARPKYAGSDEHEIGPWGTLRNLRVGTYGGRDSGEGFSILPNFDTMSPRDEDDDDALKGMNDISRAYEAGVKLAYRANGFTSYGTVRKGFGGHHGIIGEVGVNYEFVASDKLSFQAGVEAGYANGEANNTYFGVTAEEAARTEYREYDASGGFNTAAAILEMRYQLTEKTALLGEVRYLRMIGDAADSPIVKDKNQPTLRLGIIRNLNFSF